MSITSIITLNQLISWFKDFQQNHFFLKDFGFGEPYDIGTSVQMEFPYMWVTMNEDSNIQTANNNRSAIPDISFSIMFMDKINNQQNYLDTNGFQSDNSQEILSDTLQCVQDLIVHIQQNFGQYGVFISQDVSFYPAVDETTDKATGVVARFVLRTRQVNCVLPESPGTIVVQPQQATIQTLLTCETLDECETFQDFAYTGGTYNSGTTELTLTTLNGSTLVVSGISGVNGTSGTNGVNGTNGSSGTSGGGSSFQEFSFTANTNIIVDASLYNRATWIANLTSDKILDISNLTPGRSVKLFIKNTNATTREISLRASTTTTGFGAFILTSTRGQFWANGGLNSSVSFRGNTIATITVHNINGQIFGEAN